jgi:cation transport protein ChaC
VYVIYAAEHCERAHCRRCPAPCSLPEFADQVDLKHVTEESDGASARRDAPGESVGERGLRREDFCDEWLDQVAARAASLGNYPMLTKEEREASRQTFLAAISPGEDAWVFGYGSLMWNPAIHVVDTQVAVVHGHHRAFCLNMLMGRGSPESPGLMLALDRGGSCRGTVHRIAAEHVDSELRILWMREMLGGTYRPRWVEARTEAGGVRAITFVANRAHPRYAGKLPETTVVERIARAVGHLGTNRHYLFRLEEQLRSHGVDDGPMHRLADRVRARCGEAPPATG